MAMTPELRDLLEANAKAHAYEDNCRYTDLPIARMERAIAARALSEYYWSEIYDGPEEE